MLKVEQIVWFIVLNLLVCFGVTMSWTLVVCLMVGVAIASVVTASVNWRVGGRRWDHWDSLSLVVLGYFALRAYFSPVMDLAKEDIVFWVMGWMAFNAFRSKRLWTSVASALAVMVLLNLAYVLLQQFELACTLPLALLSELASTAEAFGIFQDYGSLANAMAMVSMLSGPAVLWGRGIATWQKAVLAVLGLAAAWICFQSDSRIGAVSLVCAVWVFFVLSWFMAGKFEVEKRKKFRLAVLLVGIVSVLLATLFLKHTLEQRDHRLAATGGGTEENIRQKYWAMALEHGGENALIGSGARTYSYLSWASWRGILEGHQADPHFVHNEYIQSYLEYGAVGLLLLTGLLVVIVLSCIRILLNAPLKSRRSWIHFAGLLVVLVAAVHSLTDFAMRIPINWVILCIGLAWCLVQKTRTHLPKSQHLIWSCFLPVVLAFTALGLSVNELRAAIPLMQVRQVRDYKEWVPNSLLLDAYTEANRLAPDFRRSYRIGAIYEASYAKGDQKFFELCREAFEESLSRHPENPVLNLNMAKLYHYRGSFEIAQLYFLRTEKFAGPLDHHGKLFIAWAENEFSRASVAYEAQNYGLTEDLLQSAQQIAMRTQHQTRRALKLKRDAMITRLSLKLLDSNDEAARTLEKKLMQEIPSNIMREKSARVYKRIGLIYLNAADRDRSVGDYARSNRLYRASLAYFRIDKNLRKDEEDAVCDTQIELIKMILMHSQ